MTTLHIPKIIAHRGAPKFTPENTIASLHKAKALGASWVEFDVMLTQDDVPVIIHDETLDRTTNQSGRVCDFTLAQLSKLDAGQAQSIPTLQQWLGVAAQLAMGINIEIKEKSARAPLVARKIYNLVENMWPDTLPKPLISSSKMACIKAYRALDAQANIAYVTHFMPLSWKSKLTSVKACALVINCKQINAKAVQKLHAAGYKVLAYTVNDMATFQQLMALGVDAVFTDDLQTVRV